MSDIMICCVIICILTDSQEVKIENESSSDGSLENSNGSDIEITENELAEEEWEEDFAARRLSFERKVDNNSHRKSFEARNLDWSASGQLCEKLMIEIKEKFADQSDEP